MLNLQLLRYLNLPPLQYPSPDYNNIWCLVEAADIDTEYSNFTGVKVLVLRANKQLNELSVHETQSKAKAASKDWSILENKSLE